MGRWFACNIQFCAQALCLVAGLTASGGSAMATVPLQLKVATYNIHGCIGRDGKLDLPRVARVLKVAACDVVGLNEVYRHSDGVSQDEELAREMGPEWQSVFGQTIRKPQADYGNAIMTRLPVVSSESWALDEFPRQERRGMLRVTVRKGDELVHVFCTHMGLSGTMRQKNAAQMVEIIRKFDDGAVVLLGDFNEVPPARGLELVADAGFTDAWRAFGLLGGKTFPSRPALRRLDYIWLGEGLAAESCYVGAFGDARVASDHRPVFASVVKLQPKTVEVVEDTISGAVSGGGGKALLLEDFEKVPEADAPAWWRKTTDLRQRGDGVGTGTTMVVGGEHFWHQESSGTLTFVHRDNNTSAGRVAMVGGGVSDGSGKALELSVRVQTGTAGDGWSLGYGALGVQVRHGAGDLPEADILLGSEVVSTACLSAAGIDPYVWNVYTLRMENRGAAGGSDLLKVTVLVNGRGLMEMELEADSINAEKGAGLWLSTNGGQNSCEIFADDFVLRQIDRTGREAGDLPIRGAEPKIIRKTGADSGSWWRNLW